MSYIVPRDKPKRCTQPRCRFMDRDTLDCRLQGKSWESFEEQYEHCPLIEVPTPHGRLIDADELKSKFRHGNGDDDADSASEIYVHHTAAEAINKIKAYEEKQNDKIEVGDEVIAPSGKAIVTASNNSVIYYLYSGGDFGCIDSHSLKKTGRHFNIASILEDMRND